MDKFVGDRPNKNCTLVALTGNFVAGAVWGSVPWP